MIIMIPHEKRFVRGILSVLLSVLLFLLTCVFIIMILLRSVNVAESIRNTDLNELLDETEIAHYIISQIYSLPFNNAWIELEYVVDFLQTEAVSNEIDNIVAGYINALNNNDLDYHLTENTVLGIVRNLEPEFRYLLNHYMTEEDNIFLTRTLDDIFDFNTMTVSGISYDVGVNVIVPRLLFSPYMIWVVGVLIVLTMCYIFLHNKGMIEKAFLQNGIPVTLSGLIYLTPGGLFGSFPDQMSGRLRTLSLMSASITHLLIRFGVILTTIGVAFTLVYLVIRYNKEK